MLNVGSVGVQKSQLRAIKTQLTVGHKLHAAYKSVRTRKELARQEFYPLGFSSALLVKKVVPMLTQNPV